MYVVVEEVDEVSVCITNKDALDAVSKVNCE